MTAENLLANLRKRMQLRKIPGLSLRLAQHQTTLFRRDLGVADLAKNDRLNSQHRFRIGSLTKPIVAQSVLQLINQGKLNLQDRLAHCVPELSTVPSLAQINIAQLLSHTSGLRRGDYDQHACSDDEYLARIALDAPLFTPGEGFKYSNSGYFLLGRIIERTTGNAAEHHIAESVLKPNGMDHSGFFDDAAPPENQPIRGYWDGWRFGSHSLDSSIFPCPHGGLPRYAAGLISTADDYLDWLNGLSEPTPDIDTKKPAFSPPLLKTQHALNDRYFACFGMFGEIIDDRTLFFLSGMRSGCSSFMFILPDLGLSGVAMANHGSCDSELRDMLYQVALEYCHDQNLPCFGHRTPSFNILAGSRKGDTLHLNKNEHEPPRLQIDKLSSSLYPINDKAYYAHPALNGAGMLRIDRLRPKDAIIVFGTHAYFERLSRLRPLPAADESLKDLEGTYLCPAFGRVEVIHREQNLYLDFGIMYETLLKQVGNLSFEQNSGPFRYETIEFVRDRQTGKAGSFTLNSMTFTRINEPECHHPDGGQTAANAAQRDTLDTRSS